MTKSLRHSRDVFHAWMLEGASYEGKLDMPALKPVHIEPERLIAFSDAMKRSCKDFDQVVHFFEDDYLIERFWNNPKRYVNKLSKFEGVIGLDYSVCWDFLQHLRITIITETTPALTGCKKFCRLEYLRRGVRIAITRTFLQVIQKFNDCNRCAFYGEIPC